MLERFMHNRLYSFLERNGDIFSLQFRFRQKYSTAHALIHLIHKIREEIDEGNYGCGIFIEF